MGTLSDGISEQRLCRLLGINRQTCQAWKRRGLHTGGGRGKRYSERDAIALASLAALFDVLPPSDAPVAWLQVRDDLATRIPDQVDLVFDPRECSAALADQTDRLSEFVRIERPVVVIAIGERVRRLRDALRRIEEAEQAFGGDLLSAKRRVDHRQQRS